MTEGEKREIVQKEITRLYPQLVINCRKTCGAGFEKWGGDLLPMCIEMFLQKTTPYIYKVYLDGKTENFITYMMGLQLKSSSSRFFHHYRKFAEKTRELLPNYELSQDRVEHNKAFEDESSLINECMKKTIAKLNPYEKMILNEIIIDGNRFNHISEKYNINYYSLKNDCEKIKLKIKHACKHLR